MVFFDYPGSEEESLLPAAEVFLPDASEADWSTLLRHCRSSRFAAGQTVISPGGVGRSLFLIVEGSLEVLAPVAGRRTTRYRRVSTVGAGSVIGEISFFDGGGRTALVRSTTPVEVMELTVADFEALAAEHPDLSGRVLFDLGRILARRLRAADNLAGR